MHERQTDMSKTKLSIKLTLAVLLVTCLAAVMWLSNRRDVAPSLAAEPKPSSKSEGYSGSVSCRKCHEKLYKLWAPSHHGLAMQPYTDKDSSGDELDSIKVSGYFTRNIGIQNGSLPITITGTVNVDLDIEVNVFAQAFGVAVVTDKKILGADYGLIITSSILL